MLYYLIKFVCDLVGNHERGDCFVDLVRQACETFLHMSNLCNCQVQRRSKVGTEAMRY